MAQLSATNVFIGYDGKTVAKDINFSINRGDYISVVGENGSGKSTLIKTILRLNTPQKGEIVLGDGLLFNDIGYLPQQTKTQKDFPASVEEVVMSGFLSRHKLFPFYSGAEKSRAKEQMRKLEIADLAKKSYRELSGGQQQRVFLARALCAAKKMIVLDEPATGLDPRVTKQMYDLIQKINKEDNITVIMVSHDVRSAIRYSSHILHIGHDNTFFGTTDEYLTSETAQKFLL